MINCFTDTPACPKCGGIHYVIVFVHDGKGVEPSEFVVKCENCGEEYEI